MQNAQKHANGSARRLFSLFFGNNRPVKTLYENCYLPLTGERRFAAEDGRFAPAAPPFGARIDLGGAVVLPAFLDAHSHILAYALSLLQADGSECAAAADYAAAADAFARAHGLDAEAFVTVKNVGVFPPSDAFDALPRPLHLQARSGHSGMFNERARRLLGLKRAGVLEETEYLAATEKVPMPAAGAIETAFLQAQADYFAGGAALAQEGFLTRGMFPVYEALRARDAMRMDVIAYVSPADYDEAIRRFPPHAKSRLRVGGMKIFFDGSPQQKTAFLREPYVGGGVGTPTMTEAEAVEACAFAAARGAQLLAHCNGDGAAERFLSALARLSAAERARIRPVLIHGQIVGDDQIERAAALGVTVSFFPAHIRYWGEVHRKNLGQARAERISPARSALRCGIPFTLHQDSPVCRPDLWEAAACAVNRTTAAGTRLRGQEISVREALLALTRNAARQYGFSDMGGTAPGMRANFLLADRDPLALPPEALETVRTDAVFLGGACAFRRTPSGKNRE